MHSPFFTLIVMDVFTQCFEFYGSEQFCCICEKKAICASFFGPPIGFHAPCQECFIREHVLDGFQLSELEKLFQPILRRIKNKKKPLTQNNLGLTPSTNIERIPSFREIQNGQIQIRNPSKNPLDTRNLGSGFPFTSFRFLQEKQDTGRWAIGVVNTNDHTMTWSPGSTHPCICSIKRTPQT